MAANQGRSRFPRTTIVPFGEPPPDKYVLHKGSKMTEQAGQGLDIRQNKLRARNTTNQAKQGQEVWLVKRAT
eukprot:1171436-Karenia_brevis.AAC.1